MADVYLLPTATNPDWTAVANWSGGAAPANGDNVILGNSSLSFTTGLNQSAVTLASLTVLPTYTGIIGTSTSLDYLQIGATLFFYGSQNGQQGVGSQKFAINFGSVQTTAYIYSTASASATIGTPSLRLKGTHASNACYVYGSSLCGWAVQVPFETSTVDALWAAGACQVFMGAGCTLDDLYNNGGTTTINGNNFTNAYVFAGRLIATGNSINATLVEVRSGALFRNYADGTIAAIDLSSGGQLDYSVDPRAKTITALSAAAGAQINLRNNGVSPTVTGFTLVDCALQDIGLSLNDGELLVP